MSKKSTKRTPKFDLTAIFNHLKISPSMPHSDNEIVLDEVEAEIVSSKPPDATTIRRPHPRIRPPSPTAHPPVLPSLPLPVPKLPVLEQQKMDPNKSLDEQLLSVPLPKQEKLDPGKSLDEQIFNFVPTPPIIEVNQPVNFVSRVQITADGHKKHLPVPTFIVRKRKANEPTGPAVKKAIPLNKIVFSAPPTKKVLFSTSGNSVPGTSSNSVPGTSSNSVPGTSSNSVPGSSSTIPSNSSHSLPNLTMPPPNLSVPSPNFFKAPPMS